jgi:hypothetical protein
MWYGAVIRGSRVHLNNYYYYSVRSTINAVLTVDYLMPSHVDDLTGIKRRYPQGDELFCTLILLPFSRLNFGLH